MVAWRARRGVERPNATRSTTRSGLPVKKRRGPAINRLRFTDRQSVFIDCAPRQSGVGEPDGPVIAWSSRRCVWIRVCRPEMPSPWALQLAHWRGLTQFGKVRSCQMSHGKLPLPGSEVVELKKSPAWAAGSSQGCLLSSSRSAAAISAGVILPIRRSRLPAALVGLSPELRAPRAYQ